MWGPLLSVFFKVSTLRFFKNSVCKSDHGKFYDNDCFHSKFDRVRHFGAFHDEHCIYFVSEFVSGGDLFAHLRRLVRFKKSTAMFYAAQVLIVLEHLHSLQIVYRDIKPENIVLDRRGYIKLIDFGLSKILEKAGRFQVPRVTN